MIYDTFTFFNELDLLEIRLNELDKVVDKFVLVESPFTYSGKAKPLFFQLNKKRFSKFLHKINYVMIEDLGDKSLLQDKIADYLPECTEYLKRENIQRNAIMKGLTQVKPDDLILISDLDEIPPPKTVFKLSKTIKKGEVYGFKQKVYYYYLNLLSNETIMGTKMTRFENIDFPQNIRQAKKFTLIDPGGWHFSFLGGVEKIKQKIDAYFHQEYNTPTVMSQIPFFVENRLDIFERPYEYTEVPIDDTFPKYIQENKDKYCKYIAPATSFDDNTKKLIQEIVRLRKIIEEKKHMEGKYNQIVDSAYFKLYPLYLKLKKIFKKTNNE